MIDVIPVRCENCGNKTLYIKPGDKAYCLTEECIFECVRYPTDPERELPENRPAHNIYVRRLEQEVLQYRCDTQICTSPSGTHRFVAGLCTFCQLDRSIGV